MITAEIEAYYDLFRDRLLSDYEHRNPRVTCALAFAEETLAGARSILDVGCGIGWSTDHMRRWADVTGLDISPVLIETARELFGGEFICADFRSWQSQSQFDAVLLIDAYEHFPRFDRSLVHSRIRAIQPVLVVLTVPTEEAMQHARDIGAALQPVDENVSGADLLLLAQDLGGEVEINRTVSIWEHDDYRHVLIRR